MKKYLFLFLFQAVFVYSERVLDFSCHELGEIRGGIFFFTNELNRDVYDSAIPFLELEGNHFFSSKYSAWGNAGVVWSSGKTKTFLTLTKMNITTVSIGMKRFVPISTKDIKFYVGAGLSFAVANTRFNSDYMSETMTRISPGIVGKLGFLFQRESNIFLDIFFDYYFQPTLKSVPGSFYQQFTDLGGFRTGLGIGYLF